MTEPSGPLPVVAIVGRPNVGKSTLVNRILGRRAAVVQDIPGVTRDRISYDALWNGKRFTLVDTGGWDPKATGMAASITRQAKYAMDTADVIVLVVDSSVGATDTDLAAARILRRSDRPVILVANKVDDERSEAGAAELWSLGLGEPQAVSALHGRSSGDLLDLILDAVPEAPREQLEEGGPRRVALVGSPWWDARTWASRACSTGWPRTSGPSSTPSPGRRSTRWTRSSPSAGRSGGSSTPPVCGGR